MFKFFRVKIFYGFHSPRKFFADEIFPDYGNRYCGDLYNVIIHVTQIFCLTQNPQNNDLCELNTFGLPDPLTTLMYVATHLQPS